MRTRELASYLVMQRNTLGNMLRAGLFRDGLHRRKINTFSPRGEFLWNQEVVLMTLGRLLWPECHFRDKKRLNQVIA
ncbi:DNA-binding protein [bacterium]|nr:DNA-binding protein [bacterium]